MCPTASARAVTNAKQQRRGARAKGSGNARRVSPDTVTAPRAPLPTEAFLGNSNAPVSKSENRKIDRVRLGIAKPLCDNNLQRSSPRVLCRVEEWRGGVGVALRVGRPFRLPVPEYPTMLRFHSPLIEPDGRISRIRLSDQVLTRSHTRRADEPCETAPGRSSLAWRAGNGRGSAMPRP